MIDVSQAEEGMVLTADALDKRGRVLIPAGKELTAKHINALPAWGVQRIEVEGDDIGGVDVEPWAVEAAEAEIEELFSLSNTAHPAIEALIAVCTERAATRIQEASPGGAPAEPGPTDATAPDPAAAQPTAPEESDLTPHGTPGSEPANEASEGTPPAPTPAPEGAAI